MQLHTHVKGTSPQVTSLSPGWFSAPEIKNLKEINKTENNHNEMQGKGQRTKHKGKAAVVKRGGTRT